MALWDRSRTVTSRLSPFATGVSLLALVVALVPLALARPVPLRDQPFPDAPTYADTAFQIANGNGFGTVIDERLPPDRQPTTKLIRPSRYPPAYPLVLAPFVRIGDNDPSSAQTGARWIAGLLVVALFLASFVLGGPVAATIAALVSFVSPFAEKSSRIVMSDAFGAALVLLVLAAVGLAWRSASREPLRTAMFAVAGFLAAYAVFVRISAAGILASVAVAARQRRLLGAVALGAIPVLMFLGAYQWTEFGSPVRSGYDYYLPQLDAFSPGFVLNGSPTGERQFIFRDKLDGALMRWTCPCDQYGPMGKASNAVFYPAVLLGVYWVFSPPLFTLLGIWEIVRRRSSPVGQFAALVVVTNVGLFLAYYYQGARLVAPAAYVLIAFSAAGAARLLALVPGAVSRRRMGPRGRLRSRPLLAEGHLAGLPLPTRQRVAREWGRGESVESSQSRPRADEQALPPSALLDGEARFIAVDQPRASIVIPVYNHLDQTLRCLESLLTHGQATTYEVIVVDDCSTDGTPAALERIQGIRVVTNHVNRGYVAACNKGLEAVRAEYAILLNNDTVVGPGCIDALVATADADPNVGVVGARLIYPDGRLQEAGGIIWSDAHGWNYGKGDNPHAPPYCHVRDVDYCSAACLLVRTDLITELGGFDLRFSPAYYEDADLAFAARARGYRVVYQPNAAVIHVEGVSHGTDLTQGLKRHQVRNRVTFEAKWWRELQAQQPNDPSLVLRARDARPGPRALIADHTVPTYDLDAGSMRMMGIVSLLADLGFVVTFLPGNLHPQQPYTSELQQMGVEVLFGPIDIAAHLAGLGPHLRLCVLSRPHVALPYIGLVRKHAPTATIVYDTVDLHFLREMRQADLTDDDALRGVARVTRELELALVRASDVTITVTEVEREILRVHAPDANVLVVPTIHEGGEGGPRFAARRDLLFVGNFLHPPNIDAAFLLVTEIMPLLRARLPATRLILAGSHASPEILALAGDDVEVLGWVPDLRPLYDRVRVFVAPLRFGAGMRGKLCESISHGLPVVTSTVGGEGIGLVAGRHALVADTPEDFAAEVVRLYSDSHLWSTIASAGRALIAERYSPAAVGVLLRQALEELGVLEQARTATGAEVT